LFQGGNRMLAGQRLQTHQHAHRFHAPDLSGCFSPLLRLGANRRNLPQHGVRSPLHG
jgi:hypothetical protein